MTAAPGAVDAVSVLGTLAAGVVGWAGAQGLVRIDGSGIEIDWWVGADDGWVIPAATGGDAIRPGIAPAIEARVRVPGGVAVLRSYAVAAAGPPLVALELENASPAAVVGGWVVRAAPGYRIGRVAMEGPTLLIDERARVELPSVPTRWAVAARAKGVQEAVVGGNAASGPFDPVVTRRGDLEVAVLFPVAHRTRTRIAATAGVVERAHAVRVSPANLPALADVEHGWTAALETGTQVELPDEALQGSVDAARVTVLLGSAGPERRDRVVASAAGEWGLAADAARARLRPSASDGGDPWPTLRAASGAPRPSPRAAAEWLAVVRRALVHVDRDRVGVLPHFPVEWLGRPVAVHGLPIPQGTVSFALRWHGSRPALLWDLPAGMVLRAPSLDPGWEGAGPAGEALLDEIDATRLLPLDTTPQRQAAATPGAPVDEPGSFT
jgi:hypothetical protein